MKFTEEKKKEIIKKIALGICLEKTITEISEELELSRPTVNRYKKECIESNILRLKPEEKNRYELSTDIYNFSLEITEDSSEDLIFRKTIAPILDKLKLQNQNVFQKINYCFTEMVNNTIDHSKTNKIEIKMIETYFDIFISISDFGIGIFKKLVTECDFRDEEEAIFQLSLGKLTTDKINHTGEGIFFSSKIADYFCIDSNGHKYTRINDLQTFNFGLREEEFSTAVEMSFSKDSKVTMKEIFDQFTDEELNFNKTIATVELATIYSKTLISRSEAKRIVMNFGNFKSIVLDFKNVEYIGQGFADQIFRVYGNAHPEIKLEYKNANEDIEKMIRHVSVEM